MKARAVRGAHRRHGAGPRTANPCPASPSSWRSHAPLTVLPEGARGSVSKELSANSTPRPRTRPQTLPIVQGAVGIWPAGRVRPGRIDHARAGRPTSHTSPAASSIIWIRSCVRRLLVGLDYQDPNLHRLGVPALQIPERGRPARADIVSAGAPRIAAGGGHRRRHWECRRDPHR